jgi:hypothetical protein
MRDPLALPKNLENSLAYCDLCDPPVALGWGGILNLPKHFDQKSETLHTGKLMEMDKDERMVPGESLEDFLVRMAKKYLTKA